MRDYLLTKLLHIHSSPSSCFLSAAAFYRSLMANVKGGSEGVEWRVKVSNFSSESLVTAPKHAGSFGVGLKGLFMSIVLGIQGFLTRAWDLAVDDPRKVMHCIKVGIALSVVSLFYYMRPLYDGVGGNAIWAVMTVVVVFEYTVGGTLYKCLNRICATGLAGFLALGVHWVANQSGEKFEPIIMGASVFILASTTTFSRFIPQVKARYDYGCTIFILTFSLVSVSGYRVDKLLLMAHERLSTIIIGTSLCIFTSTLIFPVWAGVELHLLFPRNLDKLASSLECCVAEYFGDGEGDSSKKLKDYKCVLNSKASEDSMANFARWEPAHGRFSFRHPWKKYLQLGTSMRSVAYCLETLNSCLTSENQAPEYIKNHLNSTCSRLSSSSCIVIRELGTTIKSMRRSSKIEIAVQEMNNAVQELQNEVEYLPSYLLQPLIIETKSNTTTSNEDERREVILTAAAAAASPTIILPLTEIFPVVSFASLLIEIAARIEGTVEAVEELAKLAEFRPAAVEKPKQNQIMNDGEAADQEHGEENMIALQRV